MGGAAAPAQVTTSAQVAPVQPSGQALVKPLAPESEQVPEL